MKQYLVVAEHTRGQSVSHPCKKGTYDDPAETLEMVVAAKSEAEAKNIGREELLAEVLDTQTCNCIKHCKPGSDDWWQSVTVIAEEIPVF